MTEKTQKRIERYLAAIPVAREKIMASALLLLIAVLVATVTTYAWVTLSRAPSVSMVTTTISSNGSLEIGLAGKNGEQPEEFDIDESVGLKRDDVMVTNRLWGNIINLADDRYGFAHLILRPAELREEPQYISTNPLQGVKYGADGRIEKLDIDFVYTAFDREDSRFLYSRDKGVRAISRAKEIPSGEAAAWKKALVETVTQKQNAVSAKYAADLPSAMSGLSDMISTYAQEKVNGTEYAPSGATVPVYFTKNHLESAKKVYDLLYECMELQKEAYVALANLQLFNEFGREYTPLTGFDELYNNYSQYDVSSASGVSKNGVISIYGLKTFVQNYDKLVDDRAHFEKYISLIKTTNAQYSFHTGGDPGYSISDMISRLISYGTMQFKIDGLDGTYTVNNIQQALTQKISAVLAGQTINAECTITDGIMKYFEQIAITNSSNYRMPCNNKVKINISVTVRKIITKTAKISGTAKSNATGSSYFSETFAVAQNKNLNDTDYIAEDTYGMAIDFWVRSNAERTYLTLAGAVVADEEGKIYRYDGLNRVWGSTGNANLTTNSTTQGGGACYVFYADSPENMNSALNLLRSMKVAFVQTSTGTLFATAVMDVDNKWAQNGRITVPLVIANGSGVSYPYLDESLAEQTGRAITELLVDEAKDITAIVYLDGASLKNEHVLAMGEIEGQLNIQFGSSEELITVGDNELLTAERYVEATATKTYFDFNEAQSLADLTTTVAATVTGTDPQTMEGFFVRAINAAQGKREEKMTFTKRADGKWAADHTFTKPGTYYLRYLRLDGVDYALVEPVQVQVSGYTISSVTWDAGDNQEVYSVDSGYKIGINATFASSNPDKLPKKVSARLERADGFIVNTVLTSTGAGNWKGTANIQSSGVYTLKYLVADGEYEDLSSVPPLNTDFTKQINLHLGLSVEVINNSATTQDKFVAGTTYYKDVVVKIMDNNDEIIPDKQARLVYTPETVDTDLTWNEQYSYYEGRLIITKAGRYTFKEVLLEGDSLTRASSAPVYQILQPDPPTYDPSVVSDFAADDAIQFAPLVNNAYIGPIGLKYAESATLIAYVTNSVTGKVYACTLSNVSTEPQTIYREPSTGNWYINLPQYTQDLDASGNPLPNATYTQEGTWTLSALEVWDCSDNKGDTVTEEKPLYFAQALPDGKTATLIKTNLSAHKTTVSCSINVAMVPGVTTLGTSSTPFMTLHKFGETGAYVTLKDDAGRVIPEDVVSGIRLNLNYHSDDTSSGTNYGYVVTGLASTIDVFFRFDDANGRWVVDPAADYGMRYVGPYKVDTLTVTLLKGKKIELKPNDNGVPEQYTVYSAAPSADSGLKVELSQVKDAFAGDFLATYTPDIQAKVSLVWTDESGNEHLEDHVKLSAGVQIRYTYQKSTKPSGISWTSSGYETITKDMTKEASGTYVSPSTPLLPGKYTPAVLVDGRAVTTNLKEITVTVTNMPTVTAVNVSPNGKFNMTTATSGNYNAETLVSVQNYIKPYSAKLYIEAKAGGNSSKYWRYTLPQLTLQLSNVGSGMQQATLTVPNATNSAYSNTFTFTSAGSVTAEIGGRQAAGNNNQNDTKYVAGTQTIKTLTVTGKDGSTYTVTIPTLTITQLNEAPPSLVFAQSPAGYTTPTGMESTDGEPFEFTLPTTIGARTETKTEALAEVDWDTLELKKTSSSKLAYISEATEKQETRGGGLCSSGTTYYWYEITVEYYIRQQYKREQTTGTQQVKYTYDVTEWKIGNSTYQPGETIRVTGSWKVEPIIGTVDKVNVGTPQTSTLTRLYQRDEYVGTKTATTSEVTSQNQRSLPATPPNRTNTDTGYAWFDDSNKKSSGDLNTTLKQLEN